MDLRRGRGVRGGREVQSTEVLKVLLSGSVGWFVIFLWVGGGGGVC